MTNCGAGIQGGRLRLWRAEADWPIDQLVEEPGGAPGYRVSTVHASTSGNDNRAQGRNGDGETRCRHSPFRLPPSAFPSARTYCVHRVLVHRIGVIRAWGILPIWPSWSVGRSLSLSCRPAACLLLFCRAVQRAWDSSDHRRPEPRQHQQATPSAGSEEKGVGAGVSSPPLTHSRWGPGAAISRARKDRVANSVEFAIGKRQEQNTK